jgi:hypothetical protein
MPDLMVNQNLYDLSIMQKAESCARFMLTLPAPVHQPAASSELLTRKGISFFHLNPRLVQYTFFLATAIGCHRHLLSTPLSFPGLILVVFW